MAREFANGGPNVAISVMAQLVQGRGKRFNPMRQLFCPPGALEILSVFQASQMPVQRPFRDLKPIMFEKEFQELILGREAIVLFPPSLQGVQGAQYGLVNAVNVA